MMKYKPLFISFCLFGTDSLADFKMHLADVVKYLAALWEPYFSNMKYNCRGHGITFNLKSNLEMKNSTNAVNSVGIEKVSIDIHFSNFTSNQDDSYTCEVFSLHS